LLHTSGEEEQARYEFKHEKWMRCLMVNGTKFAGKHITHSIIKICSASHQGACGGWMWSKDSHDELIKFTLAQIPTRYEVAGVVTLEPS
jgi:hypothetical protein